MIKIIYPDGKVEYQDVRRLTNYDLFLVFGHWATMRYLYTTNNTAGKPVDFYVVYDGRANDPDWPREHYNERVFDEYGVKVYGTAIVCKADILDIEEE